MRSLFLIVSLACAQDDSSWTLENYPVQEVESARRDERKAGRMLKKDDDFGALTDQEKDLAIKLLARKIYEVRKAKGWRWVDEADVRIKLDKTDLQTLYAKNKRLQADRKRGMVVSEKERRAQPEPIELILPGESGFEESQPAPLHNLFGDNQWEIKADGPDARALTAQIDGEVAGLGPKDRLAGVTVRSSASTLRCTAQENGKAITNRRLSELRALAARDFVLGYLRSRHGIELDPGGVAVNFEGENGNGTSGPADPWGTGDQGNGKAPYADVADYAKHRFVEVTYTIFRDKSTPDMIVRKEQAPVCSARVVALDIDTEEFTWGDGGGGRDRGRRKVKRDMRRARKGRCPVF